MEGVYPEDYDRRLEIYVTPFEARAPYEIEYRLRLHDGEYRWILDHGVPRLRAFRALAPIVVPSHQKLTKEWTPEAVSSTGLLGHMQWFAG